MHWAMRLLSPTQFCDSQRIVKPSRRTVALFVTAQFAFVACGGAQDSAMLVKTSTTPVGSSTSVDDATTSSAASSDAAPDSPHSSSVGRPPKNSTAPSTAGESTIDGGSASPDAVESTSPPKGLSDDSDNDAFSNSFAATEVLAQLTVANEVGAGYDRDLFRHWTDEDGDSCDTRQEVLIRDSRSTPQIDPYRCKVIAGTWYSPYDGAVWEDPSDVDIDHVVALKEAWDSGAWQWSSEKRRAFANDLSDSRSLMAVTDSVNQSKGDRDPSQWMPPRRDYRCSYISLWLSVKARWSLAVDQSEAGMIRALLEDECRGLRVAKWAPAPIA